MPPIQQEASEMCAARRLEIQAILRLADDRWRELETRLHSAEEEALGDNFEALKEPLGLQSADLETWTDGGLRQKVRGRMERLVLAPLAHRMRQQVHLTDDAAHVQPSGEQGDEACCHVLDDIAEVWEVEVEPLLRAAGVEDAKLERKVRRRAKVPGSARDVWKAETQERPVVWASALKALEALMQPIQRLAGFLEAEVSAVAVERLVAAAPPIVTRAMCDWRFQRCAAEFDQLDGWWQGARAALQKRETVWEQLLQEEGLFVRRVDRGVEALRTARSRYAAMADFGGHPLVPNSDQCCATWSKEQVLLLAEAVRDMRGRLRPIRDSAAWRVVDAAKVLQRRLRGGGSGPQRETTPWERASRQEGARQLVEALTKDQGEAKTANLADPADAALVFMQRLDRLTSVVGDLIDFSRGLTTASANAGLAGLLERLLQAANNANEELLAVMDDPSADGIAEWRGQWDQWGAVIDGQALDAAASAASFKPESSLSAEERQTRKRQVTLLRGIQVFLQDPKFRSQMIAPVELLERDQASSVAGALDVAAAFSEARERSADAPAVDQPPSSAPAAAAVLSPRSGALHYAPPRRTRREEPPEEPAAETRQVSVAAEPEVCPPQGSQDVAYESHKVETPPVAVASPKGDSQAQAPAPSFAMEAAATTAESPVFTRPSTAESWARPVTPSWLLPPWPRPDTPSAASWTRPDTPSTVCDADELAHLPKVKFVDGQRVTMRPGTGTRLPPLRLGR